MICGMNQPLKTWLALVAGSLALVVVYATLAGAVGYGFLSAACQQ